LHFLRLLRFEAEVESRSIIRGKKAVELRSSLRAGFGGCPHMVVTRIILVGFKSDLRDCCR